MNIDPYEPCPCGSGRKFKFCCRGKSEPPFIAELRPGLDRELDELLRQVEIGAGKEAGSKISSLLRAHPDYHVTHYAMGVYLVAVEEDPREALPYFEKAVEIFPYFAEAHFNLGNAAMKTGDVPKAVASFRAAQRYSRADGGLAEMARDQLRFLEEITLKGSPFKSLDAYVANAKLFEAAFQCLKDSKFDQAAQMFERIINENPRHVQSHGNLALAYAGLGRKAAALESLARALQLDPEYEPALANRGLIAAMREGEPSIPAAGIQEIHYYLERLHSKHRLKTPG